MFYINMANFLQLQTNYSIYPAIFLVLCLWQKPEKPSSIFQTIYHLNRFHPANCYTSYVKYLSHGWPEHSGFLINLIFDKILQGLGLVQVAATE